jgi:uncharacterized membrane protein YesL
MVLNLLTMLCCIPIITTGAAMAALYRSLFDMRKGNGNIIKGYFKAFVANLRPGLVLGVILILICISFVLYLLLFQNLIVAGDLLVLVAIIFAGLILFLPMVFSFPLLSMFENSALRTLANAFLLSFRHFGTSLVVLVMFALPWVLMVVNTTWFIRLLPLFIMFALSLPGWFASALFLRIFKNYSEIE